MKRSGLMGLLGLVLVMVLGLGICGCKKSEPVQTNVAPSTDSTAAIHMPMDSKDLIGRDCQEVVDILTNAGFTNVVPDPSEDLMVGLFHDDGEVMKVTVNGSEEFTTESVYPSDQEIVVTYHSYQVDIQT